MKLLIIEIHLIALYSTVWCQASITQLCAPETIIIPLNISSLSDEDQNEANEIVAMPEKQANCDCRWENSMPWGQMILKIACHEKQLENKYFEAEDLPPFTDVLDMSWNNFMYVPQLVGSDLTELDISHNVIQTIDDNNFEKIPNLKILNLCSNNIMLLSINAFAGLSRLAMLDLSKNQLKMITINVFVPLTSLRHLILSRNRHINETLSQRSINLYLSLGVVPTLEILEVEGTNIDSIDLANGIGLKELRLKGNSFQNVPDITRGLEVLDLSRNPITTLSPKFLPHLGSLISLIMNDMPHLKSVQEYSLFGLPNLKHLSFQGSWNLSEFSSQAFGSIEIDNYTKLEVINFKGTSLTFLNSSLFNHLENVKVFDLSGNPLRCDCNIKWIIDLGIETNGLCVKPLSLRGRRLSNISENQLECKKYPGWVYTAVNGLLVLLLLIVCGVCTWLLVMGLKPLQQGRSPKLGITSPYARITIEPNRGENLH